MNKTNFDLPIGQMFKDLDKIPLRNPQSAAQKRAEYLQQVAVLRHSTIRQNKTNRIRAGKPAGFAARPSFLRLAVTAFLIVILLLGASATTVYASQESLPGQSLYPVKTLSEDAILALTADPQTRLDLELDYTDRRISEMDALVSAGLALPSQVVDRLQTELDAILQDAAEMSDTVLAQVLPNLRLRAEVQLQIVDELKTRATNLDLAVIEQAQTRIREQVRLCAMGEIDPAGFRLQVRQRYQYRNGSGNYGSEGGDATSGSSGQGGSGYGPGGGNGQQGADSTPSANGNGAGYGQPTTNGEQTFMTPGSYGPGVTATEPPGEQKKGH